MLGPQIPPLPHTLQPRSWGMLLPAVGGPSFDHLAGVAHFRKEPNSLGRRDEEASSFLYFQTQLEYLLLQEASLTI